MVAGVEAIFSHLTHKQHGRRERLAGLSCVNGLCVFLLCQCLGIIPHVRRRFFRISLWCTADCKHTWGHAQVWLSVCLSLPSPALHSTLNTMAISPSFTQIDTTPPTHTHTDIHLVFVSKSTLEWSLIAWVIWWVPLHILHLACQTVPWSLFSFSQRFVPLLLCLCLLRLVPSLNFRKLSAVQGYCKEKGVCVCVSDLRFLYFECFVHVCDSLCVYVCVLPMGLIKLGRFWDLWDLAFSKLCVINGC